jgi:hypothetical protein
MVTMTCSFSPHAASKELFEFMRAFISFTFEASLPNPNMLPISETRLKPTVAISVVLIPCWYLAKLKAGGDTPIIGPLTLKPTK